MEVAREHGLVFNIDKCEVKKESIKFFGLVYDADGAHPDPDRVEAIKAIKAPSNAKELQVFLGIATYMSPFIPNLSMHTAPLRELIKKDSSFEWLTAHQTAFEKIKDLICKEVTLSYFDMTKETTIQVDASLRGVGAALIQDSRVISFSSKSFTDTEQRYANIEREMLAVVYACEKFHTYVYGKPFTVESDHKPLEMIHLKNLRSAPPRLQRMLLRLQGYDVTIKYKPGSEMLLADAMSRLNPLDQEPIQSQEVHINFVQFSDRKISAIRDATNSDPELAALKDITMEGWPDKQYKIPQPLKHYWSCRDELSIENGIIMKGDRVVIPKCQQPEILTKIHEAHQGVNKCQLRAKSCVYWQNINKDIESLVKACPICQECAKSQPPEPLHPHDIPSRAWQIIGTDIFILNGEEFLLVADYYSKFPIVKRIPKGRSNSSTIINILKEIFSEHGCPERVVSDNGPHYSSQAFKSFAQSWNFEHVTSSPRYPQSNGFIERQVQTVKNAMQKARKSGTDMTQALLCIRSTPISNKLPSPAELLYDRKLRGSLPVKVHNGLPMKEHIAEQLQLRQDQQKTYHDRKAHELHPLHIGQHVRVQDQDTRKWMPAIVQERRDEPRSYNIQTERGSVLRRNRRHIRETGGEQTQRR
jgi:transposase InsO family protein